jgi:hypothetical protein
MDNCLHIVRGVTTSLTRAELDWLYDQYRITIMNRLYYADRLEWSKWWNLTFEIIIAIGTSGVIAGWAIWSSTTFGKYFWPGFAGFVAVLTILKPILQLPLRIERYSKLWSGYNELAFDIGIKIEEVNIKREQMLSLETFRIQCDRRLRDLRSMDDHKPNIKKLSKCEDNAIKQVPIENLWYPSEDGEGEVNAGKE